MLSRGKDAHLISSHSTDHNSTDHNSTAAQHSTAAAQQNRAARRATCSRQAESSALQREPEGVQAGTVWRALDRVMLDGWQGEGESRVRGGGCQAMGRCNKCDEVGLVQFRCDEVGLVDGRVAAKRGNESEQKLLLRSR